MNNKLTTVCQHSHVSINTAQKPLLYQLVKTVYCLTDPLLLEIGGALFGVVSRASYTFSILWPPFLLKIHTQGKGVKSFFYIDCISKFS